MAFREQLCGCFNDVYSCLIAFEIPFGGCIVHALATHQITNKGFLNACLCNLLCCFGQAINRQEIRRKLMMPDSYFSDCITYFCCMACATTQDYREAENRYLMDP